VKIFLGKKLLNRAEILERIESAGVVAVMRLNDRQKLEKIVNSICAGGVNLLEITFTSPNALEIISDLSKDIKGDYIVGAGTVLDPETAEAAILAGAQFIVSPVLDIDIIKMAHQYDKVCICGAFSATEIYTAWKSGADIVKVFPATSVGPQYLKDIHGPLPQIKLSPTGGVSIDNAEEFIKKGACCIGVGTALLDKTMIAESNWGGLTKLAEKFRKAVEAGRK